MENEPIDAPPTGEQRFKAIQRFIEKMPSLSTTVTKVLEVCNQPNTSSNDLNKVISLDPVLTGQVLKLINSAYYSLPDQVTSLTRAIIMLGINTVKNLALSTAILGTISKHASGQGLAMDAFWTHSISTGVAAKALAAKRGITAGAREEYFVAGLLHDLGKVPMSNCLGEEYGQALMLADLEQGPLYRAENTMLGFDHSVAGNMIAEKWQLSPAILDVLRYHHQPEMAGEDHRLMVATVALANIYANIYDFGGAGDRYPAVTDIVSTLDLLSLHWSEVMSLTDTVKAEIEKAQIFLKISQAA